MHMQSYGGQSSVPETTIHASAWRHGDMFFSFLVRMNAHAASHVILGFWHFEHIDAAFKLIPYL